MARTYKTPPVVEAVCEFRFASLQPWDWTIPGLMYDRIQDTFPNREQASTVEMTLDLAGKQITQQAQPRIRLSNDDKTELVQLAPGVLSIHQVRPYRAWEHFKSRIVDMLETYREIARSESLTRVGLRYLNLIELPPGRHELSEYFHVVPQVPEPVPQVFQSFLVQSQIPYGPTLDEPPDSWLRLSFGTVMPEASPEHHAFVLDSEMFTADNAVPSVENVSSWLEIAHTHIKNAFEACFTEKTHEDIFGEVKP